MPVTKQSCLEQETLIIDSAIKCIEKTSLLDFTMASIAKEAKLSMGSVYKHVQSKEDVLVAIATRMMTSQCEVFSAMMNLPLTMPERLMCNVLMSPKNLYVYSFGVHLEMLAGNEAVLNRASSRWLDTLMRIDKAIGEIFNEALKTSWENGELLVEEEIVSEALEMLTVGLWSMSVGFIQVAYQRQARQPITHQSALPFPLESDHGLVKSAQCLINAQPWQEPLNAKGILKVCTMLKDRGYR